MYIDYDLVCFFLFMFVCRFSLLFWYFHCYSDSSLLKTTFVRMANSTFPLFAHIMTFFMHYICWWLYFVRSFPQNSQWNFSTSFSVSQAHLLIAHRYLLESKVVHSTTMPHTNTHSFTKQHKIIIIITTTKSGEYKRLNVMRLAVFIYSTMYVTRAHCLNWFLAAGYY